MKVGRKSVYDESGGEKGDEKESAWFSLEVGKGIGWNGAEGGGSGNTVRQVDYVGVIMKKKGRKTRCET